jgi:dTDP-4-amino-4,6-dideoxygalactose transaminase
VAAFSLNGPKPLSAGEGGFVLTDDEAFYRVT